MYMLSHERPCFIQDVSYNMSFRFLGQFLYSWRRCPEFLSIQDFSISWPSIEASWGLSASVNCRTLLLWYYCPKDNVHTIINRAFGFPHVLRVWICKCSMLYTKCCIQNDAKMEMFDVSYSECNKLCYMKHYKLIMTNIYNHIRTKSY